VCVCEKAQCLDDRDLVALSENSRLHCQVNDSCCHYAVIHPNNNIRPEMWAYYRPSTGPATTEKKTNMQLPITNTND